MNNPNVKYIQKTYKYTSDLIVRKTKHNNKSIYIVFLESISNSKQINNYILKNIDKNGELKDIIASPSLKTLNKIEESIFYLSNGFTIIINDKAIYAVETKADLGRSISEPTSEISYYGPKDAFTENIQTNIGLIKRRIKSVDLKIDNQVLGKNTKTNISLLYMDNLAEENLIKIVKNHLAKIKADAILDSNYIADYMAGTKDTALPTIMSSERPDRVCQFLIEGRVILLTDTSPFALIFPTFFIDFINPVSDNYNKNSNISFVKILRFLSFFLTIILPGLYVAVISYNSEIIPTPLLLNFINQSKNLPFPVFIEAVIMLIICEILRESDARFPNSYGSAISILGALVLGEAAVSAGIVSPIMIIIFAFSYITSFMFPESVMMNAIRKFRWLFLIAGTLLGIYGILLSFIFLLIHITSLDSVSYPYFYPISPFEKETLKGIFIKTPLAKDKKRSSILADKNINKKGKE